MYVEMKIKVCNTQSFSKSITIETVKKHTRHMDKRCVLSKDLLDLIHRQKEDDQRI